MTQDFNHTYHTSHDGVHHSLYFPYAQLQEIYSVFLRIPGNMVYLANIVAFVPDFGNIVEHIPSTPGKGSSDGFTGRFRRHAQNLKFRVLDDQWWPNYRLRYSSSPSIAPG